MNLIPEPLLKTKINNYITQMGWQMRQNSSFFSAENHSGRNSEKRSAKKRPLIARKRRQVVLEDRKITFSSLARVSLWVQLSVCRKVCMP